MIIARQPDGRHVVTDRSGNILAGPFETNAQAWRWIDRQNGEPISRAEKVTEWITNQIIGAGSAP